ncbi:WD-domain-containing protein [Mycena sanguinolenta]|uniref:WD-domain-containing protein n=1 Tax=Mycena sanguinolenta TaxID=230812 RepID=A0A8H7D6Y1_9AGAR|nr:WD-domain-containing protein [Mycena sanguinolenta]
MGYPCVATAILEAHTDQVWILEWNHEGNFLASASYDKSVIIWGVGLEQKWEKRDLLPHPYPVVSLAWSPDDSILLAGTEHHIKMWYTKTGICLRTLEEHSEPVSALAWLPDDSGFLSAGLDFKIVLWSTEGQKRDIWGVLPVRVVHMVITPDFTRLLAIGTRPSAPVDLRTENDSTSVGALKGSMASPPSEDGHQFLVFDIATRRNESLILFEGELTSLTVSANSQYALVGRCPNDLQLWDLNLGHLVRTYTGHKQSKDIIRSCFGDLDSNIVLSGSEDGKIYVWNRDTGALLEVLEGHGEGSVNCVACNPRNPRIFASCSDDSTVRVWEAPRDMLLKFTDSSANPNEV